MTNHPSHPHLPAVFIGDVALDEYYSAETWPHPGDKAEISTIASYVGGSIANAARVHAKLGGETEFISLLNESPLTAQLLEDLEQAHVGSTHMLYDVDGVDQKNLIFLVDGEHIVFTPDCEESPMVLSQATLDELSCEGFVYTTQQRAARLRAPGMNAVETVRHLQRAGRKFVFDLDVGGLRDLDPELLRGAHMVMMNDRGIEQSFPGTFEEQPQSIQEWLEDWQVHALLHSRAAHGARVYTRDETIDTHSYSVDVVDVTGAGDTLGGALVYSLGAGRTLRDAVELAVAAASRSVTYMGPQGGVATEAEIRNFMKSALAQMVV